MDTSNLTYNRVITIAAITVSPRWVTGYPLGASLLWVRDSIRYVLWVLASCGSEPVYVMSVLWVLASSGSETVYVRSLAAWVLSRGDL